MPHYDYHRPAVAADAVVFNLDHSKILLIQRKNDPYKGQWALPGGFLDENEDPATAVARELTEETGLKNLAFSPLGFWGAPGRDPRGHIISLVFTTDLDPTTQTPAANDDAADLAWFPVAALPAIAFDHADIIQTALAL